MKRFPVHRGLFSSIAAGAVCSVLLLAIDAQALEVTVSRYATASDEPSAVQRDPLAAPAISTLPASVRTVGDAIEQLLTPSGYRLSPPFVGNFDRAELLGLPLPEVHRSFGALPLRTALQLLAGPAFTLVEDPVHRLVSFERCMPSGEES